MPEAPDAEKPQVRSFYLLEEEEEKKKGVKGNRRGEHR